METGSAIPLSSTRRWASGSKCGPLQRRRTPDEGGKAPSDFEIRKTGTKLTPITTGPEVAKLLLDTLEEIEKEVAAAEKEQQDTAKLQKEDEKKLAEAKKERDAAKKKLDAAKTEDEKRNAQAEFENAEENIKFHEGNVKIRKEHIASRDPAKRQQIIDAAYDIKEKIDDKQDELLNPVNFGSIEDDKKLADWVSETTSTNYRSMIKDEFALSPPVSV
jgi:hypothetical protein